MRFNIKNRETTSFKKRKSIGYKKPELIFGDFSITLLKSFNIEYMYIYNVKRSLKKFFKFKKSKNKKLWLFLHKNYPLTKKSKNSRMGKGKGSLSRYCSRVKQNHNLFEFIGFNIQEIFSIKRIFKKKTNIPLKIYSNFFINFNYNFFQKNKTFFFFRSYKN